MPISTPTYIEIIGLKFPTVGVETTTQTNLYSDLVHVSGDPIPAQADLDAAILSYSREYMWIQIQEERTRRQNGGVYVASADKWFHSDTVSRIQQLGLLMMGQSMPGSIQWKTMDGSFIQMTPTLAEQIFNAAATLDMTAFAVAEQHHGNMLASQTPISYDYSGGWPAIYGG